MNTLREWKTTATVVDLERKAFWMSIFESDTVPIESILPIRISTPEHSDVEAYMLDLRVITPEQRKWLIEALAKKFDLDVAFVESEIDRQGVPILAEHVVMMSEDLAQIASLW